MLNTIQRRFALSKVGARNFCQGVLATVLLDIALMLPVIYTFIFLEDYMSASIGAKGMQQHALPFYLLLGVAFMLVLYLVGLWQYKSTYNSVYDESARRRIDLAEKLRKLPLAFFGEKNLSDLTATIMDDNSDLEHTFSHAVPQLFASLITLLLMATGLFFFQWKLALSLLWVVPVALGVLYIAKRWIYKNDKKNYDNKRKVSEAIQEGLENVQEIKSYNREAHYLNQLGDSIDSYESTLAKSELSTGILVNGAQSLLKLGLATVVIFGAQMVATSEISIFTYILFMVIGAHLYLPIMEVMLNLAALIFLDVRINRMNEMKDLAMQEGKKEFSPQRYDIEFKGVDFAYETGKAVLNDLSFVAKQGEITALIGASGSGKSTVAKLAARFWDINKGKITVGGIDISKIDAEVLLKDFSIVFQDVVLFNASVMDNIRIGKRSATDEEVMRVAKLARCDQFINRLPEGYHTIIGENGETLSGGERQRISIARALLKDAPIVLLDEATASLDIENETLIQSAILELVRRKTVLIIAHRMRTIANADKVVVLKDGQVVEQGNPKDLQKQGRYFSKMIKLQTLEL